MSSNYQTSVDCSLCAAEMARPFALSWGGGLLRGEKRGLFVCMCCFFSLQHPSYQKNHTDRVCAAEAVATATGERAAIEATQSMGGRLHIVIAHSILRCVMIDFGN